MNLVRYWRITPTDDKVFDIISFLVLLVSGLLVLYPLYFIIIASFSEPVAVNSGQVWLWVKDFTLEGYKTVFNDPLIWNGYKNSLIYTFFGTIVSVSLTLTSGYALSRKDLYGRGFIMFLFVFTMFFSGGLIPKYLLVSRLGWINTVWAMIIPDAVSVFNIIIARTFFDGTLPKALLEATKIDGGDDFKFFFKIALPLSKPLIAIMVLFYAIGAWNAWFNGMLYLQDKGMYTLNLILRDILIKSTSNMNSMSMADLDSMVAQQRIAELVKYVVIIVSSVPVLTIYPFVQKYFVKGVMIGSVKE